MAGKLWHFITLENKISSQVSIPLDRQLWSIFRLSEQKRKPVLFHDEEKETESVAKEAQ